MNTLRTHKPIVTALILLIMTLVIQSTAWAKVIARVDRTTIYEGESVALRISSDGTSSAKPDLSILEKDFTITGNSTSSQYSFINGQQSNSTNWTILLEPKNKGKIQIPPIKVGDEFTPEFILTIDELPEEITASLADDLFIDVNVDVDRLIYVQQQIPYTLKFYFTNAINNGDLNAPEIDNTVIEKLGKDKHYREVRDEKVYNVIERQYVISAERSGTLTIPPTTFKGHASMPYPGADTEKYETLRNHDLFSRSPFSRRQSRINRPVQTQSKAYTIQVQPRPGQPATHWLPAQELKLADSWTNQPPQMKTGEPITRTLTIKTRGLTGSQLPVLNVLEPQGARIYPDSPTLKSQTDGKTVYGSSEQTLTYIPNQAGILTIPEIKLQWWDINDNALKTSTLPQWEVNVSKGIIRKMNTKTMIIDGIKAPVPTSENLDRPVTNKSFIRDSVIILAVILFMITGIFLINRRSRKLISKSGMKADADNLSRESLLFALERDCSTNNPEKATKHLLQLIGILWGDSSPQTLGELASKIREGKQTILELDQYLYGRKESVWNGSQLLALIKQGLHKKDTIKKPRHQILKPLYPQQ